MKYLFLSLSVILIFCSCSSEKIITDPKELHSWGMLCYYVGKYNEAIELLSSAAEKDYVLSQYNLGIIYLKKCRDYDKAYYWLNEAASQYYPPAQYFLGTLYDEGIGLEKNEQKAIDWYERASNPAPKARFRKIKVFEKEWSAHAKYRLGMICFRKGNYEKALDWFHSAAKQSNDSAMFQLGLMYEEGIGIKINNKKAAFYYSKAAKIDHFWYWGAGSPNKDGGRHVGMIKAPKSHQDARYRYAKMCHDGRMGFHNYSLARKYFQKAASSGHIQAQKELGLMYKRGQGGKQDRQQALQWLSKAAQQGDAEAQYHTAVLLEHEKDSAQALELYRKSWENGYRVNENMLKMRGIILPDSVKILQHKTKRMALLIGNDDYPDDSLKNPRNDVYALKEKLKSLGFDIRLFINLRRNAMNDSIESFYRATKDCIVTLFYFAGHGSQENDENFMYPARTKGIDIEKECIKLSDVVKCLDISGETHNIIILDACRTPFKSRKLSQGTSVPEGLLIALSTNINNIASDGDSLNSPYMDALLNNLGKPGLNIEEVFNNVDNDVEVKSGGSQAPRNFNNLKFKGRNTILNQNK